THYLNSNTITHNLTLPKEMISRVNVALGKDSFKNTLNYTYSNFILSGDKIKLSATSKTDLNNRAKLYSFILAPKDMQGEII
ncbi:MAG: hypothetical protein MR902_07200, partial [Campylobacter sp.]|nr:hypothetical protein [Campylobacter sp.]